MMEKCAKFAHWPLRLAFFGVFFYHGLTKFPNAPGMAEAMSMPLFLIYMVALAEVLAAIFVIIGGFRFNLLTRLGGLLAAPIMLVAIIKFHWGQWSFMMSKTHPMGGIEFQVMLLAVALYFAMRGNESG